MADLQEARQDEDDLYNDGKPVPAIPRWVDLLDPFCNYDVEHLAEMAPPSDPRAPLASLLVFIDVEN